MRQVYMFDTGEGFTLVAAENAEQAKEMVTDPALAEAGLLTAEVQAKLALDEGEEVPASRVVLLDMMGLNILSEAMVVAVKASVKLFKDESIKLFNTADGHYTIAAKDRDEALAIIGELATLPHRGEGNCSHTELANKLKASLNEQETPRAEFPHIPKMISREVISWYKNLPPPEPPLMAQPPYVM